MATWTDPVDRADGYVVGQTVWNQLLGDTGNLAYLYENMTRFKYKTASQDFAGTTTYADITATSGNLAFTVAASTSYFATWELLVTAVGTAGSGGLKLQLTGPSAPTAVQAYTTHPYFAGTGADRSYAIINAGVPGVVTAFSSNLIAYNAYNPASADGITGGLVRVTALIVNGSNSGTVTLQGAQNTGAGTTTIGSGRMFVHQLGTA